MKANLQKKKKKKKLVDVLNLGLHHFYKGHFLKKRKKKWGVIKSHLRRERRQGDSPLTN